MRKNMKKILVIGDSHKDNCLAVKTIRQVGLTVITAEDGIEGLEMATGEKPDLILMDFMSGEIDALTVIERLKRNNMTCHVPLIIMGESEKDNLYRGILKGADDFITLPLDKKELMVRIKNNLKMQEYRSACHRLEAEHETMLTGYSDIIYRLNVAAEYWEEETENHIRRISHLAKELAQSLGMDKAFVEAIYHASAMHDVGKVGIPDTILSKRDRLMPDEREIMKTHTTIGARILSDSDSPLLKMASEIALTHHEKFNGGGYPVGLKGEEIPLSGRITNIVDQYDALRSARPFKRTLYHETAVTIITDGDGRTLPDDFDPHVLRIFEKISPRLREIYETYSDDRSRS